MALPCGFSFPKGKERINDDTFVFFPHRIGNNVLICGKKNTAFPYQMFVGPEWPCMLFTYTLIIIPTFFFIKNVGSQWGPAVMVIAVILALSAICTFTFTACSDPGIVFLDGEVEDRLLVDSNREPNIEIAASDDIESHSHVDHIHSVDSNIDSMGQHQQEIFESSEFHTNNNTNLTVNNFNNSNNNSMNNNNGNNTNGNNIISNSNSNSSRSSRSSSSHTSSAEESHLHLNHRSPHHSSLVVPASSVKKGLAGNYMDCNMCQFPRPKNASHCYECNLCVEDLDHHCPWTGKCIGKKNLKNFHSFLWSLSLLILYVVIVVIYTSAVGKPLA